MKPFLFLVVGIFVLPVLADKSLSAARELAQDGIIVDQSTTISAYGINAVNDIQESSMYRLSDRLIRQEALGIALKAGNVYLPENYVCKKYYLDVQESCVCRMVETAADSNLVTRENNSFRPHDGITLAEGIGILVKTLAIKISSSDVSYISGNLPDWQKRLILTIKEKNIPLNVQNSDGSFIALHDELGTGFDMSLVLTRGQFFELTVAFLDFKKSYDPVAHCVNYSDGCNECMRGENGLAACTKRACFWQGIPECYTCEEGYALQDGVCIKETVSSFDSSLCASYYDGCNSCSRGENGDICTLKYCSVPTAPYCTSYTSYTPTTQEKDSEFISKVITEIQNYTQDRSCTDNDQCQWMPLGAKACGGPVMYIPFSTKNVSKTLLQEKASYLSDIQSQFNIRYEIMSDCMFLMPPEPIGCVNNLCQR